MGIDLRSLLFLVVPQCVGLLVRGAAGRPFYGRTILGVWAAIVTFFAVTQWDFNAQARAAEAEWGHAPCGLFGMAALAFTVVGVFGHGAGVVVIDGVIRLASSLLGAEGPTEQGQ